MFQIKCRIDNPFDEIISRFFQEHFSSQTRIDKENLLEILTDIIIGTKETRVGSIPKPESLVVIRDTIRKSIELNAPIPILVPFGGRKANKLNRIDVAEVSAIKQLIKLDESVKQFHPHGLHTHIGIEDLGAEWLFKDDEGIEDYSSSLVTLVDIFRGDTHIEAIRESTLMTKSAYFDKSHEYAYLLEDVLTAQQAFPEIDVNSLAPFKQLQSLGWKGTIDKSQREYYLNRYAHLYPELTMKHYINMLADYFAGAKARYDLNGKAEPDSSVGSYIKMSFASPIPNAPTQLFNNTVYWRTVPLSNGRTHVAAWRGRGYLSIDKTNTASVKVTNDPLIIQQLEQDSVTLIDDAGHSVEIDTSYLIQ